MAYRLQDEIMGLPAVAAFGATQAVPEGFIVHGFDPVYGGAEFIYLKGAVGTVAGSLVSYDTRSHTTTLGPPGGGGNTGAPLAVAMSANVANNWGWYQVSGNALVAKDATALSDGGAVGLGTVAGTVGAVTAGKQVLGATASGAAAGGAATARIQLSRPHAQGAIT